MSLIHFQISTTSNNQENSDIGNIGRIQLVFTLYTYGISVLVEPYIHWSDPLTVHGVCNPISVTFFEDIDHE